MNQQDPVRSVSKWLWTIALSALGLVLVINVTWALLQPVLPLVFIVGGGVLVVVVWNRWRWR